MLLESCAEAIAVTPMKFTELNLNEKLIQGIDDAGFTDCLPVQEQTYRHTLAGCDVMVQSQTGSGKTAAFLVSIYQLFAGGTCKYEQRALIIAPTRELAAQIEDEAQILGAHLPYRTGCFYGGVGYDQQERLLKQGVDIVIGTPGRLIDLNQSGKLSFSDVGILVIDEADRLFDMGFLPDLRRMLRKMPEAGRRQTMLFSATLSATVRGLALEHMNNPVEVEVAPEQITVETVTQEIYHVGKDEKIKLLLGLLKKENPSSALIFTNMKTKAIEVARRLAHNGFGCEYIIGDLPQKKRLKIINAMKSGSLPILVATDVAARGLHINDLDLVVNYDLPLDPEAYVHRIGRTARAGKTGKAITMVCERYVYGLEAIESLINMKIPVAWALDDDYADDASAGMRYADERRGRGHDRQGRRSSASDAPSRRTARAGSAGATGSVGQGQGRAKKTRAAGKPKQTERSKTMEKEKHPEKLEAVREHAALAAHAGDTRNKRKRRRRAPAHSRSAESAAPQAQAREHRPPGDKRQKTRGPDRKQPIEDRLAYYRKKYGEDFASSSEPKKPKSPKLIEVIKGIFSRKKTSKKS